jgi:hypoxanthine phosphoribosyltransferase
MGQLHPEIERILITTEEIQARVIELSKQITADFSDADQLYIVGILKGAFIFMADLTRHLQVDHTVDFMALSSYGKTTTTGAVRILMDLREPIDGKHVLIIEDIVDSGNTLSYLLRILRGRKPTTLRTCALLRKQREAIDIPIDYLGFDIPDEWVVGYGLDFAEKHRTLPYIATIKR